VVVPPSRALISDYGLAVRRFSGPAQLLTRVDGEVRCWAFRRDEETAVVGLAVVGLAVVGLTVVGLTELDPGS
jgi:hypothetical protein